MLAALYVIDPASDATEAALDRLGADVELHAPDFVLLEVGSVLWKRVRRRELSADSALAAIADLSAAAIRFHAAGELAAQALALGLAHGFTVYDATYVALATRLGAVVVTNDGAMRGRGLEAGLPIVAPDRVA